MGRAEIRGLKIKLFRTKLENKNRAARTHPGGAGVSYKRHGDPTNVVLEALLGDTFMPDHARS